MQDYRFDKILNLEDFEIEGVKLDKEKLSQSSKKVIELLKQDKNISINNIVEDSSYFLKSQKYIIEASYNLSHLYKNIVQINFLCEYEGHPLCINTLRTRISLKGNYMPEIEYIEQKINQLLLN